MNWSRGLFRLWVLSCVIVAAIVGGASYEYVANEFQQAALVKRIDAETTLLLPVDCKLARGKEGEDYERHPYQPGSAEWCWYEEPKLRKSFPEYKDMETRELSANFYGKAGIATGSHREFRPWYEVGKIVGLVLLICASAFAAGASILWALAGFKRM